MISARSQHLVSSLFGLISTQLTTAVSSYDRIYLSTRTAGHVKKCGQKSSGQTGLRCVRAARPVGLDRLTCTARDDYWMIEILKTD
jgi:hypothetical protein